MEITVVFADLSSFTEMTGRLGATTTYSVVDEFLRLASTTLMSHGAFIDKYIGDAVMALFNVPIKRADHAEAAVAASAKLQQLLPELSERLGMPFRRRRVPLLILSTLVLPSSWSHSSVNAACAATA